MKKKMVMLLLTAMSLFGKEIYQDSYYGPDTLFNTYNGSNINTLFVDTIQEKFKKDGYSIKKIKDASQLDRVKKSINSTSYSATLKKFEVDEIKCGNFLKLNYLSCEKDTIRVNFEGKVSLYTHVNGHIKGDDVNVKLKFITTDSSYKNDFKIKISQKIQDLGKL